MSECRVYSDPPWSVIVTHADQRPSVLEQVTVRCVQPGCGGVFRWVGNNYYGGGGAAITLTRGPKQVLAQFAVCSCTRKQFAMCNGEAPPWLTKEERVAWLLT